MRIAITGSSGFLGSALRRRLANELQGATVLEVGREQPLPPADILFHLAGTAGIEDSLHDPARDLAGNAGETLRRLEELRGSRSISIVVLASSCAVYGKSDSPVAEDALLAPRSPYGVSKAAAELYATTYRDLAGIDVRIARIANPYGAGQRRLVIYDLARRALREPPPLRVRGHAGAVRDFIHADDVAGALVAIGTRGEDGGVYNVGSGVPTEIREVAEHIARETGLTPDDVGFEEADDPGKVDVFFPDIGRLSVLGFEATRSLEDGIRETVEWVRSS